MVVRTWSFCTSCCAANHSMSMCVFSLLFLLSTARLHLMNTSGAIFRVLSLSIVRLKPSSTCRRAFRTKGMLDIRRLSKVTHPLFTDAGAGEGAARRSTHAQWTGLRGERACTALPAPPWSSSRYPSLPLQKLFSIACAVCCSPQRGRMQGTCRCCSLALSLSL